jgi:nicotinamidase/pyrazinamidase
MNNKILLIIDPQYDFLEGGKLAVNGATASMDKLAQFIIENGPAYDKIILTTDWHPFTHCSFKDNGGMWPIHCIQHSKGAAIYEPILEALNKIKADYLVLRKGVDEDHEEYSIFKNAKSCDKLITICEEQLNVTDVDVCGIALDVCVYSSIKDGLRGLPYVNFHLMKDFCPYITENGKNEVFNFVENTDRLNFG